tara:strand:+ start:2880 stop:3584 length:705 start_codon:yes stop_codon:yes gene_type:complete
MAKKLLFILLVSFFNLSAQETHKTLFSEALTLNLDAYNTKVDNALERGELSYAKSLLDTLVKDHLQGTYIDALKFESLNTFLTSTEDIERPTLILTYASWCIPSEGEIPVLSKMAERYGDMIDFVVLFWDDKSTVKKLSKQFDKNIQVVYVDETQNKHMRTVNLLKHSLGLSLSFVIASNGEILDLKRRPANKLNASINQTLNENMRFLVRQIAAINIDLNINLKDLPESLATF